MTDVPMGKSRVVLKGHSAKTEAAASCGVLVAQSRDGKSVLAHHHHWPRGDDEKELEEALRRIGPGKIHARLFGASPERVEEGTGRTDDVPQRKEWVDELSKRGIVAEECWNEYLGTDVDVSIEGNGETVVELFEKKVVHPFPFKTQVTIEGTDDTVVERDGELATTVAPKPDE